MENHVRELRGESFNYKRRREIPEIHKQNQRSCGRFSLLSYSIPEDEWESAGWPKETVCLLSGSLQNTEQSDTLDYWLQF